MRILTAIIGLAALASCATPPPPPAPPPKAPELTITPLAPEHRAAIQAAATAALNRATCLPLDTLNTDKVIVAPRYAEKAQAKGTRLIKRVALGANIDDYYPQRALRLGIEGRALVQYDIELDGSVSNPRILLAAPDASFEQAALKITASHRFETITKRCEGAVEVVDFRMPR